MISAFVVICLFGTALALMPEPHDCLDVRRLENFNNTRYMGKWYDVKVSELFNIDWRCSSVNFVFENGVLYMHSEYFHRFRSENTEYDPVLVDDKIRLRPDNDLGKVIIATDYTSYAISYVCDELTPDFIGIKTRERHPSEEVLTKALNIVKEKFGNVELFHVNQTNCETITPISI